MKFVFLSIIAVFSASCSQKYYESQYTKKLDKLKYIDEPKLYSILGYPNSSYQLSDSRKVITYHKKISLKTPSLLGVEPYITINHENLQMSSKTQDLSIGFAKNTTALLSEEYRKKVIYKKCLTSFLVENRYIIDYYFSGDGCGR